MVVWYIPSIYKYIQIQCVKPTELNTLINSVVKPRYIVVLKLFYIIENTTQ